MRAATQVPNLSSQIQLYLLDGLKQIAFSASCSRLLSVTLNRGHKFESLEAVQGELSKYVMDFAPTGSTQTQIPFMTTAESLGSRDVIAQGVLESGGAYLVEESSLDGGAVRRLVFAANAQVIQTEVRLLARPNQAAKKSGGGGKKASGKNKGNKGKKKAAADGDALAASTVVDPTYLCFDYHRAMVAALALLPAALLHASGLVVGLGGGALPMAMHHLAPGLNLTCLELDAAVARVAIDFFGFGADAKLRVSIANGLAYDYGTNALALVFLDVDSKDTSVGMSAPPQEFLEASFLSRVKAGLREGGILVANLSARSNDLSKAALDAIRAAFPNGRVFTLKPSDDDVNTIIIAVNGTCATLPKAQTAALVLAKAKKKATDTSTLSGVLRSRVREWLLDIPEMRTDPLGLMELVAELREITV
jgi:spermidine synthase